MKKRYLLIALMLVLVTAFTVTLMACSDDTSDIEYNDDSENVIQPSDDNNDAPVFEKTQINANDIVLNKNISTAGSVSLDGDEKSYYVGDQVTITATTNSGYLWLGWYDGDTKVSVGDEPSYTFTLSATNLSYTATYALCTDHTVTNCVCTKCGTAVHTYSSGTCSKCGFARVNANNQSATDGEYVLFGSYPQTLVTDTAIISALGTFDKSTWINYGYYAYENGSSSSYMYYVDKTYGGNTYRGVYFTEYRPKSITESSSTSNPYQDDNGYSLSTVYWFRYEPIKWKILTEDYNGTGNALVLSEIVIDSQAYHDVYITDGQNYFSTDEDIECSEWYETLLSSAKINVISDDCNVLGEILKNSGSTSSITSHSTAQVPPSIVGSFDVIGRLFDTVITRADDICQEEWNADKKLVSVDVDNSLQNDYAVYFDNAIAVFDGSNVSVAKDATSDVSASAIIGINKAFTMIFETGGNVIQLHTAGDINVISKQEKIPKVKTDENGNQVTDANGNEVYETDKYGNIVYETYSNGEYKYTYEYETKCEYNTLLTVISRLFGYSDVSTFSTYAKRLIDTCVNNKPSIYSATTIGRMTYNGSFYTESGSYVFPFVIDNSSTGTLIASLVITTDGDTYIWFNDLTTAFKVTNVYSELYNQTTLSTTSDVTVYGRCRLFDEIAYANNYKYSTIREWLNDEFYNTAFSTAQYSLITTTTVDNSATSAGYSVSQYACQDTADKIFLPSYEEVTTYENMDSDSERRKQSTDYADVQGCYNSIEYGYVDECYWWLRSARDYATHYARYVYYKGNIEEYLSVYSTYRGVAPCMVIKLD